MTSPRDLRTEADLDPVKSYQRVPHVSQLLCDPPHSTSSLYPLSRRFISTPPPFFPSKIQQRSRVILREYCVCCLALFAAAAAAAAGILAASTGARKRAPGSILLCERVRKRQTERERWRVIAYMYVYLYVQRERERGEKMGGKTTRLIPAHSFCDAYSSSNRH